MLIEKGNKSIRNDKKSTGRYIERISYTITRSNKKLSLLERSANYIVEIKKSSIKKNNQESLMETACKALHIQKIR